jgi:PTH1 family peptidyl-tRNA hydrolase
MFIIVGLGNPGEEYAHTRHNLGRMVLESIAHEQGTTLTRSSKHAGHVAMLQIAEVQATILLPDTYMNKSGSSVKTLVGGADAPGQLVVVYDDIDLPSGTVRVAFARGSGGHNGVESVAKAMKTKEFVRVRIGCAPVDASGAVRKPKGEDAVVRFLMSNVGKKEREAYADVVVKVREALSLLLTKGKDVAMNVVNTA